jgi:MFS family permease
LAAGNDRKGEASGSGPGRPAAGRALPTAVLALGAVSFFNDLSSEMIYPLLPLFLTAVLAAGPSALGIIEGVAESTASLLKLASGLWSDRVRRRKPLVVAGYALASSARPLIGLAGSWPVVLALRFADRVGKGLRTSPRDALIADLTEPGQRGRAYGIQRALDHAGAVAGPLLAAFFLRFAGLPLRQVFLLAAVPAAFAVAIVLLAVREPRPREPGVRAAGAGAAIEAGAPPEPRSLGRPFYSLMAAFVIFTLGNSTDAFLLLRLSDAGASAATVAALWSALHVVKALSTYAGGLLSDRAGRRPMLLGGWLVYAAVYAGFALAESAATLNVLFIAYGLYFGLTEPVEKAWVSELVPDRLRGTAFGVYHAAVGLSALPASIVFGFLWQAFGPAAAFFTGAGLAAAAALVLFLVPERPRP